MATYSNLGIKLLTTGSEAGAWGTSTNDNFELFDTAIVGYVNVVLATAGSSGSPNALQISDFAASNGRNRIIEFSDAGDLGGSVYVQVDPNDFEGYWFIKNNLTASRAIILFQGTYNSARALTIPNDCTTICRATGTGSTSYVYNVYANAYISTIRTVTGSPLYVPNGISVNSSKITSLGTPTAGTDAATKAYVDSSSGGIAYASGNQILFRASAAGTGSVPSGWSIASQDNKALRIVSGTPSSGGATGFTSAFNAAVTSSSAGSHSHTFSGTTSTGSTTANATVQNVTAYSLGTHTHTYSGTTSTASAHTHSVTIPDLLYYDFNVIQKT